MTEQLISSPQTQPPAGGKAALAHRWIRDQILGGQLRPGSRLVLSQIADELGISVLPVREAVRQLQAERLVEVQRNVGATVAMVDDAGYREVMETLAVIESAATGMAAPLITIDQIEQARELNRQLKRNLDDFDPVAFTRTNRAFHALLYSSCPNEHLLDLVRWEWTRLDALRESSFALVPERAKDSVTEHDELIDLIAEASPPAVIEAALRAHRGATLAALLQHNRAAAPSSQSPI